MKETTMREIKDETLVFDTAADAEGVEEDRDLHDADMPADESSFRLQSSDFLKNEKNRWRGFPFLLAALCFGFFIFESGVEAFLRQAALRWPLAGVQLLACAACVLVAVRRCTLRSLSMLLGMLTLAVLVGASLLFDSSDPHTLTFMGKVLEAWVGPLLAFLLGFMWFAFAYGGVSPPRFFQVFFLCIFLGATSVVLLLQAKGLSYEEGLYSLAPWATAPFYLRPAFLALLLSFPLGVLGLASALPWARHARRAFLTGTVLPLLSYAALGALWAFATVSRQWLDLASWMSFVAAPPSALLQFNPEMPALSLRLELRQKSQNTPESPFVLFISKLRREEGKWRAHLLVRNPQGQPLVGRVSRFLQLQRDRDRVSSVQVQKAPGRLGSRRHLFVVVDLPATAQEEVRQELTQGLQQLADSMNGTERLYVSTAAGLSALDVQDAKRRHEQLQKIFAAPQTLTAPSLDAILKTLAGFSGVEHVLLLAAADKIPATSKVWGEALGKQKVLLSLLAFRPAGPVAESVYAVKQPADLGYQLLSAASESLGDFILTLPELAPEVEIVTRALQNGTLSVHDEKLVWTLRGKNLQAIQEIEIRVDEAVRAHASRQSQPVLQLGGTEISLEQNEVTPRLDIASWRLSPGRHRVRIGLKTQHEEIGSDFEIDYQPLKKLQFVKPLDGSLISGVYSVMLAAGDKKNVRMSAVELMLDGVFVQRLTAAPLWFSIDTNGLAPGEHRLQAVQRYSDQSSESAQVTVKVVPELVPVNISKPGIGEYLPTSTLVEVQSEAATAWQTQKIEFLLDGEKIGEALEAPFVFFWDNQALPAGDYFLQAVAVRGEDSQIDAVPIRLSETELAVQPAAMLEKTGGLLTDRLEVLVAFSGSMGAPWRQTLKSDLALQFWRDVQEIAKAQKISVNGLGVASEGAWPAKACGALKVFNLDLQEAWSVRRTRRERPLAEALRQLESRLQKTSGTSMGLLWVDGVDSCGEALDPIVERIKKRYPAFRLHVFYVGDSAQDSQALRRVAELAGGAFYAAGEAALLREIIGRSLQIEFSLSDADGHELLRRPLGAESVKLRSGTYRLTVHTEPPVIENSLVIGPAERVNLRLLNEAGRYRLQRN